MTEASVSSAFMAALRKRLYKAVVIKHRDASFIGLPDCSVTFRGRIIWMEYKLWAPPKRWDGTCDVRKIAEKSPAQYDMMQKLGEAGAAAWYIVWAKKTGFCFLWAPYGAIVYKFEQKDLVDQIATMMEDYADAR